MRPIYIVVML